MSELANIWSRHRSYSLSEQVDGKAGRNRSLAHRPSAPSVIASNHNALEYGLESTFWRASLGIDIMAMRCLESLGGD
jgi:hypothetical protein